MSPSRWCPTPEQVMILEEIYRKGLKTPSAAQIQHMTCHLSSYGRIEGKNVFYWFQNHKARDRQKLRRKLYNHFLMKRHRLEHHPHHHHDHDHFFFPYFLQPHQLPTAAASFHRNEGEEEGSTTVVERSGGTSYGGDEINEGGDDAETTLRTLELFPVRGSWVKDEESTSTRNGGWEN